LKEGNESKGWMTNEERRELALEILSDVENEILENEVARQSFVGFDHTLDGEPIPRYNGESPDGRGSFICEYMPLAAVMTLITECEADYEKSGEEREYVRKYILANDVPRETVRRMATIGTKVLLMNIRAALCEAVDESFLNASAVAEGALKTIIVQRIEKLGRAVSMPVKTSVSAAAGIEEAAQRVAEKKRAHLRDLLSRLPNMITEARRGRKERVSLADIRVARDALKAQRRKVSNLSVALRIGCEESTVRKKLKDEGVTLESL
jgi:hypothetical protein